MTTDPRDILLERLREDLIGCTQEEEVLEEKPSDRYLTGILYPQRMQLGAEEDERLGIATGDESETDEGSAEEVPGSSMQKPASAGLSFFCEGPAPVVRVRVTGGRYRRQAAEAILDQDAGTTAPTTDVIPGSEGQRNDSEQHSAEGRRTRAVWNRTPVDFVREIELPPSGSKDIPLDEYGLERFRLHHTTSPAEDGWLVTIVLVNGNEFRKGEGPRPDELALFQVALEVTPYGDTRFRARPSGVAEGDADAMAAALLFRDAREFAVGHTCSARWTSTDGINASLVATTWLPRHDVRMVSADGGKYLRDAIERASLNGDPLDSRTLVSAEHEVADALRWLPGAYDAWISDQRRKLETIPEALREQAERHLLACDTASERMRKGLELLDKDAQVREAFHLMNVAMGLQRRWATQQDKPFRWRPFQLGFILHSIESVANPSSDERGVMDLLWFPTGGGKTEAYLGLIAFTLFLRRLRRYQEADAGGGTCCIMRYTLRLLTLQQFQRAATLILACEFIRRRPPEGLGAVLPSTAPMGIGLWVGSSATPNTLKDAFAALGNPYSPTTPKQLNACPCCRSPLDWRSDEAYDTIRVTCSGGACELARTIGPFPIQTVDELIYREPPSLLFATIDKFAQIVRSEQTLRIFNRGVAPPPELIIQDELHLISGPLGTLTAVYECAVDRICESDGVRAKIIGSTATIRRAGEQIRALFDREVAQFPPPGLDADDSCFAAVPDNPRTRRYAGITTAGRSAKFTLQALYASLLQAESRLEDNTVRDGYHTLVGYFNSLRELGGALVLAQDDVPASLRLLARRRGEQERDAREVVELTSRVSQSEIRDLLERLEKGLEDDDSVDVVLATNMISVGVDVGRLALMVVFGQPKGIAEYIQATSRVGRTDNEGLVITVFNSAKARDRSHFETFSGWHSALYRGVEATSVTPFASRARDRALHAAIIALARHLVPGLESNPLLGTEQETELEQLADELAQRAERIDPSEGQRTRRELREIINLWRHRAERADQYWKDRAPGRSLLISAEQATARLGTKRDAYHPWPTLNSMRNVEPGTPFRLTEGLSHADATDDE